MAGKAVYAAHNEHYPNAEQVKLGRFTANKKFKHTLTSSFAWRWHKPEPKLDQVLIFG
jgi:hypothetical protein